jgi:DNA recombination protein RmuC
MGTFRKQWELFVKSMDKMGKKLEEAQSEFQVLSATRRTQLERPLRQIEELRQQKGLEAEPLMVDAEVIPVEADTSNGSKAIDENS